MIISARHVFGLFLMAAVFASAVSGSPRQDVTPPPLPSLPPLEANEDELLLMLPVSEREVIGRAHQPRERFEAWLDASDMRLNVLLSQASSGAPSLAGDLRVYEAMLVTADRRLRSPAARVRPRDKLYKNFEKRLGKQLNLLRALVGDLSSDDSSTGHDVVESVKRLRVKALHSALDVNVLETP